MQVENPKGSSKIFKRFTVCPNALIYVECAIWKGVAFWDEMHAKNICLESQTDRQTDRQADTTWTKKYKARKKINKQRIGLFFPHSDRTDGRTDDRGTGGPCGTVRERKNEPWKITSFHLSLFFIFGPMGRSMVNGSIICRGKNRGKGMVWVGVCAKKG
jgi:hypothetical protein